MNNMENETLQDYCERLQIVYDENEPEKWYTLPEYLPTTHRISNYGRILYKLTGTVYRNFRRKTNVVCTINDGTFYNIGKLLVYLKYKYMRNKFIGKVTYIDDNKFNCKLSNVTSTFSIMSKNNAEWEQLISDFYINKYGEVVNKRTGHLISTMIHKKKYKVAKIGYVGDNSKSTVYIAKSVAELFVPNPGNYKFVDYLDGNILNCVADNLRWTNYTRSRI